MDAIEIFFAAYGALLALAVGRLIAGAARLIEHRSTIRIGWLTPLLMLILLHDLATLISSAWRTLGSIEPGQRLVVVCLCAAGAYNLATSLVVPSALAEGQDLDAWYDKQKRYVIGGLILASLLGVEAAQVIATGSFAVMAGHWTGLSLVLNSAFYGMLVVLMLIRNRATNIFLLATLNVLYLAVMLAF